MQPNEILKQSLEQTQTILRQGTVSLHSQKNTLLELIAKALVEYKRADKVTQYLKDNHLWHHVLSQVDSSQLLTLKDIEVLTVFVNGYAPVCDQGNKISYVSYSVGYKFCGAAGKCVCAKKSKHCKAQRNAQSDKNNDGDNKTLL